MISLFSTDIMFDDLEKTDNGESKSSELLKNEIKRNIFSTQIPFIENQGQIDEQVKFYAKTFAGTIFVTDSNLTYTSISQKNIGTEFGVLKEIFVDGELTPKGESKTETIINYYKGDSEKWKTNIPAYNIISLGSVWKDVNVSLHAYQNNVEKIFTVFPGGNPNDIKLKIEGIKKLNVNEFEELEILAEHDLMKFSKPVAYQNVLGKKVLIDTKYVVDEKSYGFLVGDYDKDLPLVIDPLIASTFIGSTMDEDEGSIVMDSSGNIFIAALSFDNSYPTVGAPIFDSTVNGGEDIVVSKFNNNLTSLLASTFIGGSDDEGLPSIAIDSADNVFVGSATLSTNYPTSSGYQNTKKLKSDIVISKFTNNLALSASTYLGGDGDETSGSLGAMIAIDNSDNVYVTSSSNSTNFDTSGTTGHDQTQNGDRDAVVAKLNNSLSSLLALTYLGGSSLEEDPFIAIDSSGNVFVATETDSDDFPTTNGAYDTTFSSSRDSATISKFDNTLATLIASTFLEGTTDEDDPSIAFDSSGNVFVAIDTESADFPTAGTPFDSTHNGGEDIVVAKLNNSLTTLLATTFLGGTMGEEFGRVAIDSADNVFVLAETQSTDISLAGSSFDTLYNDFGSGEDMFISKLDNSLSSLLASTYLGATSDIDISPYYPFVLNGTGNVFLTAEVGSSDFPITSGAFDTSFNSPTSPDDIVISIINCNLSSGAACTSISEGSFNTITVGNDKTGSFQYSETENTVTETVTLDVILPTNPVPLTTLQVRINQENDDAEERTSDGAMTLNSSDLEFITDTPDIQQVGMRFNQITVPKNATIGSAFIQFTTDETDTVSTNLTIKGEANDNSPIFTNSPNNISARTTTASSVAWSPASWSVVGAAGNDQKTPDLKTIVQEIVNRSNWESGNSIVFIVNGTGKRTAESINGAIIDHKDPTLSPLLSITYGSGAAGTITTSTAIENNLESGTNLATSADISAPCTNTCTIKFTVPNSLLTEAGIPSSSASIFHDSNENGLIEADEIKATTRDTTTISGSTIFSTTVNSTSKFGVGVVTVSEGSSASSTVTAGGTASFQFSETESTTTQTISLDVDLPAGVPGTITVSTAVEDDLESGTNLATAADITGPCTNTCTIKFTVSNDILTAAGLTSESASIYHDSDENGLIEADEVITTTKDTSTISGSTIFTGTADFTSKFAVGGVVSVTSANAVAGISAVGGLLGFSKNSCDKNGFGHGESLEIYEISYDKCEENEITVLAYSTCGPLSLQMVTAYGSALVGMSSDQPYLDDEKKKLIFHHSIDKDTEWFSIIAKDKRDEFSEKIITNQCTGIKKYYGITGYTSEQQGTDIPISKKLNQNITNIPEWVKNNAVWWGDDQIDDETFVGAIQYLIEENIIWVPKTEEIESESTEIPEWVKNNAVWWGDDQIDDETFVGAIEYLVKNGIISVN